MAIKRFRIGESLVEYGFLTEAQLEEILTIQQTHGGRIGEIAVDQGWVTQEQISQALAKTVNLPLVDLDSITMPEDAAQILPENYAKQYHACVIEDAGSFVNVAITDPTDLLAYDALADVIDRPIKLVVASPSALKVLHNKAYDQTQKITQLASEISTQLSEYGAISNTDVSSDGDVAPIVKFINILFADAVNNRASDIHIEPDEKVLRIRSRINGALHENVLDTKEIAPALVLRLKLLSNLNISETRLPQDGRFHLEIDNQRIDVRLSTIPTQFGESVVMRLLNQSTGLMSLENLGIPQTIRTELMRQLARSNGIILVTGPTGSGKTTTLYSALQILNDSKNKIITVEDPVEYRLPRINQVQVNSQIGLTFSRVLRACLRQDPDILLVGEIRDEETMEIAISASLTGHLVLSTLHTNSASATIERLIDMGAQGYLLASSIRAILAQRLLPKLCNHCKEPHQLESLERLWLTEHGEDPDSITTYTPKGCAYCNNTGFSGRQGLYEYLEMSQPLLKALRDENVGDFNQNLHTAKHFVPIRIQALQLVLDGEISVQQALGVSGD